MSDKLTVQSILSLFQTDKAQRATFVSDIIARLEEGSAKPLEVHLQAKAMIEIAEALIADSNYREILLDEATKHGKSFDYQNAKFSIREVGTKYDYSQCGDLMLAELQDRSERANIALKARQDFLKVVPTSGVLFTDEITGETYKIYPPSKSSTTSVTVTLK
jgi:hypothetical protein